MVKEDKEMTKKEFIDYLNGLKKNFEEDNKELRQSPNNEDKGIMYNRGYITCIDNVIDKLKDVNVEEQKSQIEFNKTLEEYMEKFGKNYINGELWDFSLEDMNSGAIELNPEQVYWQIEDRLYETKVL